MITCHGAAGKAIREGHEEGIRVERSTPAVCSKGFGSSQRKKRSTGCSKPGNSEFSGPLGLVTFCKSIGR